MIYIRQKTSDLNQGLALCGVQKLSPISNMSQTYLSVFKVKNASVNTFQVPNFTTVHVYNDKKSIVLKLNRVQTRNEGKEIHVYMYM